METHNIMFQSPSWDEMLWHETKRLVYFWLRVLVTDWDTRGNFRVSTCASNGISHGRTVGGESEFEPVRVLGRLVCYMQSLPLSRSTRVKFGKCRTIRNEARTVIRVSITQITVLSTAPIARRGFASQHEKMPLCR